MTSIEKDEVSISVMSPRPKQAIIEDYQLKHQELSKSQREYKKALSMRIKKRSQLIMDKSCAQTIVRLQAERNDIRAQLWVANSHSHVRLDQYYLQQIGCHVKCQERLSKEIGNLKKLINNLQREKGRVDKQIYDLNRHTVADSQHQEYVAQVRKRVNILENRVEVGIRNECAISASNAVLKEEIESLIGDRESFNKIYNKFVEKLQEDKKYLTGLLDFACRNYDGSIVMIEKLLNTVKKYSKESEQAKVKVQSIIRDVTAADLANDFMICKSRMRPLADLHPAEVQRRTNFKNEHTRITKLYNAVLAKIFDYTNSLNVDTVIEKFQQHETLYHSYFNFVNRTSFHLTVLENAVNQLFARVAFLRNANRKTFSTQTDRISELLIELEEQRAKNAKLDAECLRNKNHMQKICAEFSAIFTMCRADYTPLLAYLGNQSIIDVNNLDDYLKIFEKRILNILRTVYIQERADENTPHTKYVVKEISKNRECTTDLGNIVLTQQCPECAEGDIYNADDDDQNSVELMNIEEVKQKLSENINQPEIQYRLHSISQCRLPKSRELATKCHA